MRQLSDRWLDRSLIWVQPHYTLCTNVDAFNAALDEIGVEKDDRPEFAHKGFAARVHTMETGDGERWHIVTIRGWEGRDVLDVYALLVHEAVHIWQAHVEWMNESKPSDEFMAYSIQSLSAELMRAFRRLTK